MRPTGCANPETTHGVPIGLADRVDRLVQSLAKAAIDFGARFMLGRHSRLLMSRGYRLVSVDIDMSKLKDLIGVETIEIVEADLEGSAWPVGRRRFDGIVVTNYLHRPLLPLLPDLLRPEGVLIYDTFAKGNEKYGRPNNPAFLLEPGELIDAHASRLRIVACEHGEEELPRPAVRQRVCAVNAGCRSDGPDSSAE